MYLEHFNLQTLPFALTPNTSFYCNLPGHQSVFNVLMVSIENGEGFIKVVAEVGAGKTILCRKLLNTLGEKYVSAFIPNPDLSTSGLRKALARELGLRFEANIDQHALLELITQRLIQIHALGKRAVLVIDEAQALSDECLEAVRLLTNLETESKKLLQVVMFGQPELDHRIDQASLRQLKQRIAFSCNLNPIPRKDLNDYICHRLTKAGYTLGSLFSKRACDLLYKSSGGLPRVINVLCHKALMAAYGRGEHKVSSTSMKLAVKDTEWIARPRRRTQSLYLFLTISLALLAAIMGFFVLGRIGI